MKDRVSSQLQELESPQWVEVKRDKLELSVNLPRQGRHRTNGLLTANTQGRKCQEEALTLDRM